MRNQRSEFKPELKKVTVARFDNQLSTKKINANPTTSGVVYTINAQK